MQYINEAQYLPGDAAPDPERVNQAQEDNVEVYQTKSLDSVSDLTSLRIIAILTKQNIDYLEQLYVDYSISFEFIDRCYI